jgi:hypothetical protein
LDQLLQLDDTQRPTKLSFTAKTENGSKCDHFVIFTAFYSRSFLILDFINSAHAKT